MSSLRVAGCYPVQIQSRQVFKIRYNNTEDPSRSKHFKCITQRDATLMQRKMLKDMTCIDTVDRAVGDGKPLYYVAITNVLWKDRLDAKQITKQRYSLQSEARGRIEIKPHTRT